MVSPLFNEDGLEEGSTAGGEVITMNWLVPWIVITVANTVVSFVILVQFLGWPR